jgi:peptidoglycan/xylan/chitin deacetylase (PgdA/CDA1 family)
LRFPRNSIAVSVILLSLILFGGGVLSWYKAWLANQHESQFASTGQRPIIVIRTPKHEIIRKKENIVLEKDPPAPVIITPSEKTPVLYHIDTMQPVVFITIDDGTFKEQDAANFLSDRQLPITAFLTLYDIKNNYNFFKPSQKTGTTIENHTSTHPRLSKFPFETQRNEICSTSDMLQAQYGRRPTLFRPPYGEYNDDTLRAAAVCGIHATILWNVVVQNGALNYQKHPGLQPGDIILLHYKPELKTDLEATLRAIREQNMQIGRLEDWVQ